MKQYQDLCKKILKKGIEKNNRTNTKTLSLFAEKLKINLDDNIIPIITTKKINIKI